MKHSPFPKNPRKVLKYSQIQTSDEISSLASIIFNSIFSPGLDM
jgi:hypothetical protein